MNSNIKQTFVCETVYHLFIAVIKSLNHRNANLIITDFTPSLSNYIPELKKKKVFNKIIFLKQRLKIRPEYNKFSLFRKTFFRKECIEKSVNENSKILKVHNEILNSEINLFFNLGHVTAYFVNKYKNNFFRMIEDGQRNYISRLGFLKIYKRKYIYKSFIGEGIDDCIKEIHVQFPEKLPKRVRAKGVKFNLKKLIKRAEKSIIKEIFLNTELNICGQNNSLIITQPLSEDSRSITEKQKVAIYKDIIDSYTNGKNIYIKVHPREKTNYESYFDKDIRVLSKDFPLEILNIFDDLKFEKGITIWSSALDNLNCINKKIFLGINYFPKIKEQVKKIHF